VTATSRFVTPAIALAAALVVPACAGRVAPVTAPAPVVQAPPVAVAPPAPVAEPPRDLVAELIATSTKHFETGQREMQLGHLDSAKASFNRALETLLESPTGARGEPRIRQHFDMLVERISAYEVTALAQGDGFAEKKYEPAAIDALLAETTFADPAANKQTSDAVAQDLQTTTHDIDIPLNERVLAFVELFTGRLKNYLEDGLGRAARYLPMIQDVFRAEGLPLDLAYVPLVESAFKPNALSSAKAKGMWQFMVGTGRENGLQTDWYVDERAEPEKATRAAAKYLKSLYAIFGDWHLALASYNGGPGRVQRALERSGRSDFWSLSASTRFLPRETRDYVPLILAAVIVAKNPVQYGLNITPDNTPATEVVALPKATDLRRVAEWADTSVELLQELNPELRRWTTPVRATDYQLRVPMGSADQVRTRLEEYDDADMAILANLTWYTVKKGETLLGIARKLKVNRTDLADANYLSAQSRVKPGQQLIVPRAPTTLLAARTEAAPPAAASRTSAPPAVLASADAVPASRTVVSTYRVKSGDTLFSISRRFDVSVESLRAWNSLRGSAIQVGQRLRIHSPAASTTRATR
jgi:membrane-bound lytic murein transglycosylase D